MGLVRCWIDILCRFRHDRSPGYAVRYKSSLNFSQDHGAYLSLRLWPCLTKPVDHKGVFAYQRAKTPFHLTYPRPPDIVFSTFSASEQAKRSRHLLLLLEDGEVAFV